jgi:hypothetical protein
LLVANKPCPKSISTSILEGQEEENLIEAYKEALGMTN